MATLFVRKTDSAIVRALVKQYNALHDLVDGYGQVVQYHRDVSGVDSGNWESPASVSLQVSAADATDLPTSVVLANNLLAVARQHIADGEAHLLADTTNAVTLVDGYATDLPSVEVVANHVRLKYLAHRTQGGIHVVNDTVNVASTTPATDQSTSNSLLNDLKAKLNAHISSGPSLGRIKLIGV